MQNQLNAPKQCNDPIDRLDAMYKCHESLEESMSLFSALQESTQKSPQIVGNFNPWKELETAAEELSECTISCLRIFSSSRKLKSSKGMETIGALYAQGSPAEVRITSFLDIIKDTCGGVLPPVVAIAAARHMMRISFSAASEFLDTSVNEYVSLECLDTDSFHSKLMSIVVGSKERLLQFLPFLLRLEIECAAEADRPSILSVKDNAKISTVLTQDVLDNLNEFDEKCRQKVFNKKRRLKERDSRRQSLNSLHRTDGEPAQPVATKDSSVPRTGQDVYPKKKWYLQLMETWGSGKRKYVASAVIGFLLVLLLRLLFLGVKKVVANSLPSSRATQKRVLSF